MRISDRSSDVCSSDLARGPAEVTAADLQANADVEILNPDLHIATMNGDGRLAIDVTVAQGRGYVSADRNKSSDTIGVIPVDSIFSPVRKATFSVEPTRVEQDTNYDKLVIDVQTDGSISPAEALASRSEEHTSELPSLMRISYAVFCLK